MLFQSSFLLLLLRLAVKLRLAPPDCLIMASHRRGRLLFAGLLFLLHGYARRLWGEVWKVEVLAMEAASDKDQFDEEFNEHLRVWTGPSLSSEAWPASWDPAEYGDGQASSGNQSADPAPPDPEDLPTTVLASVQGHLGPAAEADVPVPLEDEILYYDDYVERYLMLQEQPEEEDPTTDRPCSSGWGAVSGEVEPLTFPALLDYEQDTWIKRGGCWKRGVDRWHNRDGSLRPPPHRQQQREWHATNSWPRTWDDAPSSSSGMAASSDHGGPLRHDPDAHGEDAAPPADAVPAQAPVNVSPARIPDSAPLKVPEETDCAPRGDEADQAGGVANRVA